MLARFFVVGIRYFVLAKTFVCGVPGYVPYPREFLWFTGVSEIIGALAMLHRPLRRLAGKALPALVICVTPVHIGISPHPHRPRSPRDGVPAALSVCAPAPAASLATTASQAVLEADAMAPLHKAHVAYVDAINSNDTDNVLAVLTDDILSQSRHAPALKGKAAVCAWIKRYFGAYGTIGQKTSTDMHVAVELAFELCDYKSTDTPRTGGKPEIDTGNDVNV
jgi:uncharacterized membrane protein/ketosteroid isomerase-like protein